MHLEWRLVEFWKEILQVITFAQICAFFATFGVFKALYPMGGTRYRLLDVFPLKAKDKSFT